MSSQPTDDGYESLSAFGDIADVGSGAAGVKEAEMIDWDRVATLRADIGVSDFAEVVEMFLAESDEVIARLRRGHPEPTLEAELHFLKGSALNLGFRQLAGLCSQGEKRAAAGDPVDLPQIIESYVLTRRSFDIGLIRIEAA